MNSGERYRLDTPTIGICRSDDDHHVTVIPAGAVITLKGVLNDNHFAEVVWRGVAVVMFVLDLERRGTRMEGPTDSGMDGACDGMSLLQIQRRC